MDEMIQKLSEFGVVPVVVLKKAEDAAPLAKALMEGGLKCAEVTFRTEAAAECIRIMTEKYPEMLVGAGTVLSVKQVEEAVSAGAKFIVSPGFDAEVVDYCIEKKIPVLPGVATPSEALQGIKRGLSVLKFFPAEQAGGLPMIKAMAAPYGDMRFVPTGGINEKNLSEYLAFPKIAACGGSWMVPDDAVEAKDWGRIEALAREAVRLMLDLRIVHIGINNENEEVTYREAEKLCALFGCPVTKDSRKSLFVSTQVEMMKTNFRGTHGHIGVGTKDVERAQWHLEQRGFAFDEDTATFTPDGRKKFIYLHDEIAGFSFHLVMV